MNTTSTFQFLGADVRIVMDERNEPLFVGRDVCEVLEHSNPSKMMDDHCKGVTKSYTLQTAGGPQEVRVLTEGDVMRLIVRSTLPKAVEFERLVFDEILPSIRKTGKYKVGQKPAREKRIPPVPDGCYPATVVKCDLTTNEYGERKGFIMTTMIDAGEHAGLGFINELPHFFSHLPTLSRHKHRTLMNTLVKAVGDEGVTDTSQLVGIPVAVKLGHKWHKNRKYNVALEFIKRPDDMPPASSPDLRIQFTKPRQEEKPSAVKSLPSPAMLAERKRRDSVLVEFISRDQLKELRNAVRELCCNCTAFVMPFMVYNWLCNQMDIISEEKLTKARFAEAMSLLKMKQELEMHKDKLDSFSQLLEIDRDGDGFICKEALAMLEMKA